MLAGVWVPAPVESARARGQGRSCPGSGEAGAGSRGRRGCTPGTRSWRGVGRHSNPCGEEGRGRASSNVWEVGRTENVSQWHQEPRV